MSTKIQVVVPVVKRKCGYIPLEVTLTDDMTIQQQKKLVLKLAKEAYDADPACVQWDTEETSRIENGFMRFP